ncbi:MAG: hypothetical protein ACXWH0_14950 [Acidimicrobiia bacterium]
MPRRTSADTRVKSSLDMSAEDHSDDNGFGSWHGGVDMVLSMGEYSRA